MLHPPDASSVNFAERVRRWRARLGLTQAEAAKLLRINRSYLSQVEGNRPPGRALRYRFQILEKSSAMTPPIPQNVAGAYGLRSVPVLSWAQAGQATGVEPLPSDWSEVVPTDVADQRAFGVRLHGDSMEPKYSDGDIAILLPGTAPTNGETVVANLKHQGALCKIMHVQLDKNLVILSSYNPAYPPTEYHRDEFHWIFPVAAVIKQLRRK
jgi:phage repressor protein C with HTH and peptisase S24 domain